MEITITFNDGSIVAIGDVLTITYNYSNLYGEFVSFTVHHKTCLDSYSYNKKEIRHISID